MLEPEGNASTRERLADLTAAERADIIAAQARQHAVSPERLKTLLMSSWRFTGRPKQQAPEGDWLFWFMLAGRGFGKTLSAAQWSKGKLLERKIRFSLVAPTFADGRDTMVEGETGLLAVIPAAALLGQSREHAWNRSIGELRLANGSVARIYSSETPNRLRGPQSDAAWCEEVSSWVDAQKPALSENSTWSNVLFSTRLSDHPQIVITSTPKPNRLTRDLVAMRNVQLVRGSSYENRGNLSPIWWDLVVKPLEGTRLGRQEINAELLDEVEGALWSREQIERLRVQDAPPMQRIVVAVDPNASSDEAANSAGVIVAGIGAADRRGYVLADRTVVRGGPRAWARAAVDAYHDFDADLIVAEKNNGGEMVEITIHAVDASVPVKLVSASRGKRTRAEPISTLYEGEEGWETNVHVNQPRVRHAGAFPDLEDEMTTWTPEAESPDRMDALVWALTELMIGAPSGVYHSAIATGDIGIGQSALDRRQDVGLGGVDLTTRYT